MIGATDEPGASAVSIAGCPVWKPELLSPALADAVRATAAVPAASATSRSLWGFCIYVSSPRLQKTILEPIPAAGEAIASRPGTRGLGPDEAHALVHLVERR